MSNKHDSLMTVKDIQKLLGVSDTTVYEFAKRSDFPKQKGCIYKSVQTAYGLIKRPSKAWKRDEIIHWSLAVDWGESDYLKLKREIYLERKDYLKS